MRKIPRILSYLPIIGAVAFSYLMNSGSHGCTHAMSCMGAGLGAAFEWIVVSSLLFLLASLLNLAGFFFEPSPRSRGRKIELALFQIPLVLFIALGVMLLSR